MEKFVMKIVISALTLMMLTSAVNGRFIQKLDDIELPEIVKTCQKGCLMKFPLNAEKPNWDNLMCSDYCSLLFKDRKKKVITTLMCTDEVCVSTTKMSAFIVLVLIPSIDNSNIFFN
jgi:hypothetical protein